MTRIGTSRSRFARGILVWVILLVASFPAMAGATGFRAAAVAQPALDCRPLLEQRPELAGAAQATTPPPPAGEAPSELTPVTIGIVPVSIYAPLFVAKELGYYEEFGLDVTIEPLAGGSDLIALTASGEFDISAAGAGPAFWNALALDLPVTVIAPGHQEGSPVATPLMISKQACESGAITSVTDLAGKKVSVNAPGGTEFWLGAALATAGLTLSDVEQQFLAFPDAVAALASGAIDAAMVGEPLATQAERDGLAVRLLADFPVQGIQATAIIGNDDFMRENPEAVTGFVAAYIKASRALMNGGFKDPSVLAIIEQYTGVPADLVADAVQPVYPLNGEINFEGLGQLQSFFRERGQLEYDQDLDPTSIADTRYIEQALQILGPAPASATPAATPGA